MENKPKLTEESVWKKLLDEFSKNGSKLEIYKLLKENPNRFDKLR